MEQSEGGIASMVTFVCAAEADSITQETQEGLSQHARGVWSRFGFAVG